MQYQFGLIILIATVVGCSSSTPFLEVSPLATQGQQLVNMDDSKVIEARGDDVTIWASTLGSVEARPGYLVMDLGFDNHSQGAVNVVPGNFKAYDEAGNAIEILTPEEHQAAVADKYRTRKAGASPHGFGPAFQDTGVGMHTGVVGREDYSGVMQQADRQRNSKSVEAAMAAEVDAYLNDYVLYPDRTHGGTLWLALSEDQVLASRVTVEIPLATEIHKFQFLLKTTSPTP